MGAGGWESCAALNWLGLCSQCNEGGILQETSMNLPFFDSVCCSFTGELHAIQNEFAISKK